MNQTQRKVYIVDDDEGIRRSLICLMDSVQQPAVAYASGNDFIENWDGSLGDVLVSDIRMPEMSGIALQSRVHEINPQLPIIFITGFGDVRLAVRAMKNGAFDFLTKPFDSQELVDSIHRALTAARRLEELHLERQRVIDCMRQLTNREREILEMMVLGKPNKVMAAELSLSQRTVEVHRANVMKKMGSESIATLVCSVLSVISEPGATTRTASSASYSNLA